MRSFRYPCLASLLWLGLVTASTADPDVREEATQAQRNQAELQARIDEADDESRAMLAELRELERANRRLERENAELAPRLERRADALERREAALGTLEETRDALPALQARLVERLAQWVDDDMPFLRDERRARVASLQAMDGEPTSAERWERIVGAWRTELEYGREFDAWRGYQDSEGGRREVDYLRLGRIGFYYLTPNGREGGVWEVASERWVPLDEAQRREVRNGLRIARDRRAPELLTLPISQPLESTGEGDS